MTVPANGRTIGHAMPASSSAEIPRRTKFLQAHVDEKIHKTVKYISVLTQMKMSEVVENAVTHYARMLETDKEFSRHLMEVQYPGSSAAPPAHRRTGGLTRIP